MDNSNPMDADTVDSRRWSKADISYSEFEVVRETMFPIGSNTNVSSSNCVDDQQQQQHLLRSPGSGRSDVSPTVPTTPNHREPLDLVDEDNYNIIPEKQVARGRQGGPATPGVAGSTAPGGARTRLDSGNYHEIESRNLSNTYQEIGGGKEPSDHYQEIGDTRSRANRNHLGEEEDDEDDDDYDGGDLYQVIDKKPRRNEVDEEDDEDEEEEEEDQFYERVKKPAATSQSGGKKHGYEKIRKKEPGSGSGGKPRPPGNLSRVQPAIGSEEEDDEEDDKPDQMYESVKYPPYERLKESKDDLLDGDDEGKSSDCYEDIGYSRVKPKGRAGKGSERKKEEQDAISVRSSGSSFAGAGAAARAAVPDVSQLYAQVDKTKKRTKKGNAALKSNAAAADNTLGQQQQQDLSGNNNEPMLLPNMPLYSTVNKATKNKANKNSGGAAYRNHQQVVGEQQGGNRGSSANDNSIEYI